MATLIKQVVTWTGTGIVGTGYSTFYFDGAHAGGTADLTTLFTVFSGGLPTGLTITVPSSGELIDSITGELAGTWTDGTTGTIACTGTGVYAQGVGFRIVWSTSGFTNGRRVKGSTFVVPLTAANYGADGTLLDSVLSSFRTAVTAFHTATDPEGVIWTKAKDGAGGKANTITSGTIPDKVSWLRSRRT